MITFAELTKQVHLINDLILSDMVCGTIIVRYFAQSRIDHLIIIDEYITYVHVLGLNIAN